MFRGALLGCSLLGCSLAASTFACQSSSATSPPGGGSDAGLDAGAEGAVTGDSGAPATYSDPRDPTKWSAYSPPFPVAASGSAFDGRYVYFVPRGAELPEGGVTPNVVVRYDTRGDFAAAASWSASPVLPYACAGAGFDGRNLYLTAGWNGLIRYDTKDDFESASSWTVFAPIPSNSAQGDPGEAFIGMTFDGRYLYPVPNSNAAYDNENLESVRYDTTASFDAGASWESYDLITQETNDEAFAGGIYDGRYVYFLPGLDVLGDSQSASMIARYDTQGPFSDAGAWTTFDLSTLRSTAWGFFAGAFDGRFLYLMPQPVFQQGNTLVARYDTTQQLTAPASWTFFDTTTLAPPGLSSFGGAFDGRRVFLGSSVFSSGALDAGPASALIAIYDTQGAFDDASAWVTFDPTSLVGGVQTLGGQVFDGQYVYFPPARAGGSVLRFDSKSPPSTLPAIPASFY